MKKELKNVFYSMKKKWKSFFHYVPYLGLNRYPVFINHQHFFIKEVKR